MAWCEGAEATPLLLIASWILSFFLNHTDPSKEKEKYVCLSLSLWLARAIDRSGNGVVRRSGCAAPSSIASGEFLFRRAIERQVVTTSLESTCLGYPCFASCFLS
ncbi:unnamed protein product [Musa acuminata var. zebrina]